MGFDFLLVQPQALLKVKPRLRRYIAWQAMPAYAIKVKTVIVIDNVFGYLCAPRKSHWYSINSRNRCLYF